MLLILGVVIGFLAGVATALAFIAHKWGLSRPDWHYRPEGTSSHYEAPSER